METSAFISMIILLTASWGGFITCLILDKKGRAETKSICQKFKLIRT